MARYRWSQTSNSDTLLGNLGLCTTNAIERVNKECKRRTKPMETQGRKTLPWRPSRLTACPQQRSKISGYRSVLWPTIFALSLVRTMTVGAACAQQPATLEELAQVSTITISPRDYDGVFVPTATTIIDYAAR